MVKRGCIVCLVVYVYGISYPTLSTQFTFFLVVLMQQTGIIYNRRVWGGWGRSLGRVKVSSIGVHPLGY